MCSLWKSIFRSFTCFSLLNLYEKGKKKLYMLRPVGRCAEEDVQYVYKLTCPWRHRRIDGDQRSMYVTCGRSNFFSLHFSGMLRPVEPCAEEHVCYVWCGHVLLPHITCKIYIFFSFFIFPFHFFFVAISRPLYLRLHWPQRTEYRESRTELRARRAWRLIILLWLDYGRMMITVGWRWCQKKTEKEKKMCLFLQEAKRLSGQHWANGNFFFF